MRAAPFVGRSVVEYKEGTTEERDEDVAKPATLEEALLNVAVEAREHGVEDVRILYLEVKVGNPHIKEIAAIGT